MLLGMDTVLAEGIGRPRAAERPEAKLPCWVICSYVVCRNGKKVVYMVVVHTIMSIFDYSLIFRYSTGTELTCGTSSSPGGSICSADFLDLRGDHKQWGQYLIIIVTNQMGSRTNGSWKQQFQARSCLHGCPYLTFLGGGSKTKEISMKNEQPTLKLDKSQMTKTQKQKQPKRVRAHKL